MSLAGGLVGAGISKWNGGSGSEGFQWGELAGGFVGGGIQHYGRALAKYTAGGNGAKAAGMALRHTAAAMGVEGSGIAVGAGVGGYYGGSSGALAGAQLGQLAGGLAANFAVACFTAGTPLVVDMEGNSRPIDEIEVGDFVLARSEFDPDGPLELKRVEEKFVRTAVVMELVVHGQSIKTTAEHPFFVPAQGKFVAAGELRVGEQLVGHDGKLVQIESIGSTGEVTTVYNLRVADFHTYFVGGGLWGFDVWVHNASYRPGSIRDQIANLDDAIGGNPSALMRMVTSDIKSFSIGGYAQARQTLKFARKGILDRVEFPLGGGRNGDALLRGGTAVEIKSWTKWDSWLPSWRQRKLNNLQDQIAAYTNHPDVKRLLIQFEGQIPSEVTSRVAALPASIRDRVYLRTF